MMELKVNVSMIVLLKKLINLLSMGNINVQNVKVNIIMGVYAMMHVLLSIIILFLEMKIMKIIHLKNVLQAIMNQKIKNVIL